MMVSDMTQESKDSTPKECIVCLELFRAHHSLFCLVLHNWESPFTNIWQEKETFIWGPGFVLRLLHMSTSMTVEMTLWAVSSMLEMKKPKLSGVRWVASCQQFQGTESAIGTRGRASMAQLLPHPHPASLGGECHAVVQVQLCLGCGFQTDYTWKSPEKLVRKFQASPQRFRLHGCDVGPRGLDFCIPSRSVPGSGSRGYSMGLPLYKAQRDNRHEIPELCSHRALLRDIVLGCTHSCYRRVINATLSENKILICTDDLSSVGMGILWYACKDVLILNTCYMQKGTFIPKGHGVQSVTQKSKFREIHPRLNPGLTKCSPFSLGLHL